MTVPVGLRITLAGYDPDLLHIIANRWDIDLPEKGSTRELANALAAGMLDSSRAGDMWARLSDSERGALQTLIGSGGRMAAPKFHRLFGRIRQMGPARREREKPYLNPISTSESLFYKGLIATAFDETETGAGEFVYIPSDLLDALPTTADFREEAYAGEPVAPPKDVVAADDSAVDDMTTLLAYCRVYDVPGGVSLPGEHEAALRPYLLNRDPIRLAMLTALGHEMGLLEPDDSGHLRPVPDRARTWLDASRTAQLRALTSAWLESATWNDLRHVPGLVCEPTGWVNDPLAARSAILSFVELVEPGKWWSLDSLIEAIKAEEPDFQRPGGDYDSWYIRREGADEYLRGFESWDAVEGELIRFVITGPMHWLGMVDLGADGSAFRLTEIGLAALELAPWEETPESPVGPVVHPDGLVEVPREASRYDRFQLARVTEWLPVEPGRPYRYRLSALGMERAAGQGVRSAHIISFLRRVTGDRVPHGIRAAIERWEQFGPEVSLERMVILRVRTPQMMQAMLDVPDVRQYLGARLGPLAIEVRADKVGELADALRAMGYFPLESAGR